MAPILNEVDDGIDRITSDETNDNDDDDDDDDSMYDPDDDRDVNEDDEEEEDCVHYRGTVRYFTYDEDHTVWQRQELNNEYDMYGDPVCHNYDEDDNDGKDEIMNVCLTNEQWPSEYFGFAWRVTDDFDADAIIEVRILSSDGFKRVEESVGSLLLPFRAIIDPAVTEIPDNAFTEFTLCDGQPPWFDVILPKDDADDEGRTVRLWQTHIEKVRHNFYQSMMKLIREYKELQERWPGHDNWPGFMISFRKGPHRLLKIFSVADMVIILFNGKFVPPVSNNDRPSREGTETTVFYLVQELFELFASSRRYNQKSAEEMMTEFLGEILWQNNPHVFESMTKALDTTASLPKMDINGIYYLVRKQQQLIQNYRTLFYFSVRSIYRGDAVVPIEKSIKGLFITSHNSYYGYPTAVFWRNWHDPNVELNYYARPTITLFREACNTIGRDQTLQLLDDILQFRHIRDVNYPHNLRLRGESDPCLIFNTAAAVLHASIDNEVHLDCIYYLLHRQPDILLTNTITTTKKSDVKINTVFVSKNDHGKRKKE